ncbi:hypothetical protein F5050DRAFT_1566400 [Lentinula boryana]|uniref:C2H2-type domain-containing protein n=1 Tax=Lentinula boryana TaxID=40481 RepID=A0ABQ8QKA7_9AGAR|nr:hypothetical protein F5050DRAFT_1566400 [Lentinula boryana]
MSDHTFDSTYDIPNHVEHTKPSVHEPFLFLNAGDDVLAPPTDDFDSYLDALLIGNNLDNLHVPTVNPQIQFRGSDSYNCGPSSAFTFSSSESSYDTRSTHSESSYGYPPRDAALGHSLSLGLDSELQRLKLDTQALALQVMDGIDPATFDTPLSPPNFMLASANLYGCESRFSDYGLSTSTGNYFNQLETYGTTAGVTSTDQINSLFTFTGLPSITLGPSTDDSRRGTPRRKYNCTICPRAFARAFNLKTHMDTHNPNRKKPFICQSCDRAFSRKHDLVRHNLSLHPKQTTPSTSPESIGVSKGTRKWCDNCGKGSIDNSGACNCNESDQVK